MIIKSSCRPDKFFSSKLIQIFYYPIIIQYRQLAFRKNCGKKKFCILAIRQLLTYFSCRGSTMMTIGDISIGNFCANKLVIELITSSRLITHTVCFIPSFAVKSYSGVFFAFHPLIRAFISIHHGKP